MINYVNETLSKLDKKFTEYSKQLKANETVPQFEELIENPYRLLKKEFGDLQVLFAELGLWSFKEAFSCVIKSLKNKASDWKDCYHGKNIEKLLENIELCFSGMLSNVDSLNVLGHSSEKVNVLVQIFKENNLKSQEKNFHSIVFVDRKIIAVYLNEILKSLRSMPEWKFLRSDFFFSIGTNGQNKSTSQFRSEIKNMVCFLKILILSKHLHLRKSRFPVQVRYRIYQVKKMKHIEST